MPKDMRNEIGREEERKREMMQVMMSICFVLVTISKFQVSVDMFIYTKTKHKT
jgi:hypothetical protein